MSNSWNLLSYLRVPALASSAIAASLSGLLYWKQNELIYPRNFPPQARTEVPKPTDFPHYDLKEWEDLRLDTPDGERIHAYLLRPPNASQAQPVTILMLHGNAGNIGHRLPIAGVLESAIGLNILMVEYRGYGFSTGDPDERGINIDTQTALDYIRSRPDLRDDKIVIYGQSIGGAAAIQLVARNLEKGDIKALILENTFLSVPKLIPSVMPAASWLAPLCHQVWPSETTIQKITVPTLFLSGTKDEIVPPSHMKLLYEASRMDVKKLKIFPTGTHNDTVASEGYFEEIADFLQSYVLT